MGEEGKLEKGAIELWGRHFQLGINRTPDGVFSEVVYRSNEKPAYSCRDGDSPSRLNSLSYYFTTGVIR